MIWIYAARVTRFALGAALARPHSEVWIILGDGACGYGLVERVGSRLVVRRSGTLVAGRPYSTWGLAGTPGAGGFNGTLNGVTVSSADAGSLVKGNPATGNAYLLRLAAQMLQPGLLILVDRIWHNGGFTITSTAAQNITQPTLPSRCPTSFTDDTPATTGYGVLLGVEVSAATGAGSTSDAAAAEMVFTSRRPHTLSQALMPFFGGRVPA